MVVSDTSPINYLLSIQQTDLLPKLYGQICIPVSLYNELSAADTPEMVRTWMTNPPNWLQVSSQTLPQPENLSYLHQGERDSIALALLLRADALIIDERRGREEAQKQNTNVIGTLGVLVSGYQHGLVDLANAIDRIWQTTFHASPKLLASILSTYRAK